MNYEARRRELLIRRRRDTRQELAMLDGGELWHVLSEKQYRRLLLATLNDVEAEVAELDMGDQE